MGAPPAAAPPAQPAGPPAHITMASADVSKVPADQKPILGSLNNLFNFCMQAANTPGDNAVALSCANLSMCTCAAEYFTALLTWLVRLHGTGAWDHQVLHYSS